MVDILQVWKVSVKKADIEQSGQNHINKKRDSPVVLRPHGFID